MATKKGINYNVLEWFDAHDRQHHKKSYTQGRIFPQRCPLRKMPQWQITREVGEESEISNFIIRSLDTGSIVPVILNSGIPEGAYEIARPSGQNIIQYTGIPFLMSNVNQPIGHYEAEITFGTGPSARTKYSEVWACVNDFDCLIKLTWWHTVDFEHENGEIIYEQNSFKNIMYINSELAHPDYEHINLFRQRNGIDFPIRKIRKKILRFSMLATAGMLDIINDIPLHHYCEVEYKGDTYDVNKFTPSRPDWKGGTGLANIDITLETSLVAASTGSPTVAGEFNDDWGDDFTT